MSMFDKYDNISSDYIPNNRDNLKPCGKYYDTIVRGTTPRHSFILPFNADIIKKVILTYKQSITNILEKTGNELNIIPDNDDRCNVNVTLSQEETYLFKSIKNTSVEVQLKVILNDSDEILVTKVYLMNVLDALNQDTIIENN